MRKKTSANIVKVINSYLVVCIFYDNVSAIRFKHSWRERSGCGCQRTSEKGAT